MKLDRVIAVRNDKTVYRDGDLSIKVFHDVYTKSDVLHEAYNHACVEDSGLNIPHLHEVTTTENGDWAIVSDYIQGKTFAQLMQQTPERKEEFLTAFCDLHLSVLSRQAPQMSPLQPKLKDKIMHAQLPMTTRFDLLRRLDSMPVHHKLLHGDFNPSNIIQREDGSVVIIDWSHVTQGNATADAVGSCLLFLMQNEQQLALQYLRMFAEKSNTEMPYIRKWIPIVAAAWSVTMPEKKRDYLLEIADGRPLEELSGLETGEA